MSGLIKGKYALYVALGLLLGVLVHDIATNLGLIHLQQAMVIREVLLGVSFLLTLPEVRRRVDKMAGNLSATLKTILLCFLILILTKVALHLMLRPAVPITTMPEGVVTARFGTLLFGFFWNAVSAICLAAVVLLIQKLIYYRRRLSTHSNFVALNITIVGFVVFVTYSRLFAGMRGFDFGVSGWVLLFVMANAMVINSMRSTWVNFLNKNQKIRVFWLGGLIFVASVYFSTGYFRPSYGVYSHLLNVLNFSIGLFVATYMGMGVLSIVLHLPTASIFDRKIKEMQSLHELSRTISSYLEFSTLVEQITKLAGEVSNSHSCWLELRDTKEGSFWVVCAHDISTDAIEEIHANGEAGLREHIMGTSRDELIPEMDKDNRVGGFTSTRTRLKSLLATPIQGQEGILGILYAGKNEEYGFDDDDRRVFQAFASHAAVALENQRLIERSFEKERLEQELKIAHDAQMKLLPKQMPEVEGLEIEAVCLAANEVGGDYYDFIPQENGELAIVIGDVSGKGASAAFYMAELKGVIGAVGAIYEHPRDVLIRANEILYRDFDSMTFVSLIYAVLDVRRGRCRFSRAGHSPLLYCRAESGRCELMTPRGIGVGIDSGNVFAREIEEKELKLKEGDVLFFYTDGLTEARNSKGEEFEEHRIQALLEQGAKGTVKELSESIVAAVSAHVGEEKAFDDMTFLIVKYRGK